MAPEIIPHPGNKSAFGQRESSRDDTIDHGGYTVQYIPHDRSCQPEALTRPNADLFPGCGIFSTEAIVLNSLDFKDYNKILTLFTPHFGLIKLLVKLSKLSMLKVAPLITPLTKGTFHITKGKSDLFSFHEGSILDQRLGLRKQFARLTTAGKLVDALCQTQWPEVPSPSLYLLFDAFLHQINETSYPLNLVEIFLLKLLKHEGILQTNGVCASCSQKLEESYRFKGESYCRKDAPYLSLFFSLQEESYLQQLAHLRDFKMLLQNLPSESFRKKINSLFEQSFDQDIHKH